MKYMQLFMALSAEMKLKEGGLIVALVYLNSRQRLDTSACFPYMDLSKFDKHIDFTLVDW